MEVVKQLPVCVGLGMMKLIDNDNIELIRRALDKVPVDRLNRGEHVRPGIRALGADVAFSKSVVPENLTEHVQTLPQDLVAVGDKQESLIPCSAQLLIIKRRDPQVFPVPVGATTRFRKWPCRRSDRKASSTGS